ncbi:MAG: hypothetical protein ACOYKC_09170 [Anaerolineaceae bacterium]|jgi:hypothetical protein
MTRENSNPWRNWKKDPPKWDVEKEGNFKIVLAIRRPRFGRRSKWWIESVYVWWMDGKLVYSGGVTPPTWWRYILELPPHFKDGDILRHPDH